MDKNIQKWIKVVKNGQCVKCRCFTRKIKKEDYASSSHRFRICENRIKTRAKKALVFVVSNNDKIGKVNLQ